MEQAERAVKFLGWRPCESSRCLPTFTELFSFPPRPLQEATATLAEDLATPGLVLVEAPMGEGKTESAFHLTETWIQMLGQQGCYIALPTMATANALYARFYEFLEKTHPKDAPRLKLLHGHASMSDVYQQVRLSSVDDSEVASDEAIKWAEEWFSYKKRGLLDSFGVGTIDQALVSVLQTKHGFVRLFGLSAKTVVIDEVHAYDLYTQKILERLLEWLKVMGSSVVLLSATLPKSTKHGLVSAYGGKSESEESTVPYPRVTTVFNGVINTYSVEKSAMTREVSLHWASADDIVLAGELGKVLVDGGCVACICNTVNRAQELYNILRQELCDADIDFQLFHARYPFEERERREYSAINSYGKEARNRPRRSILVATQVVEQSLDLDFDLMVTELAPIDLLLQRSGRLFRHSDTK